MRMEIPKIDEITGAATTRSVEIVARTRSIPGSVGTAGAAASGRSTRLPRRSFPKN
jgi:hypothetical protein